jgi:ABC-type phosphate/phosphonate transport system substrate-binding protein
VGRLQLIETTGRIPQDAIVAAAWVDAETRELLRQALLAFDPEAHTGHSRVGAVQRITGFVPADDSFYLPLRRAVQGADDGRGSSPFPR